SLVISRLEDFAVKVSERLDRLDWSGRREIIRIVVRRIEIDRDSVEVVFRVPPETTPPKPSGGSWQHCTDGHARLRGLCAKPPDRNVSNVGYRRKRLNPPYGRDMIRISRSQE